MVKVVLIPYAMLITTARMEASTPAAPLMPQNQGGGFAVDPGDHQHAGGETETHEQSGPGATTAIHSRALPGRVPSLKASIMGRQPEPQSHEVGAGKQPPDGKSVSTAKGKLFRQKAA